MPPAVPQRASLADLAPNSLATHTSAPHHLHQQQQQGHPFVPSLNKAGYHYLKSGSTPSSGGLNDKYHQHAQQQHHHAQQQQQQQYDEYAAREAQQAREQQARREQRRREKERAEQQAQQQQQQAAPAQQQKAKSSSKKPVLPTAPPVIVDQHGRQYRTEEVLGQVRSETLLQLILALC